MNVATSDYQIFEWEPPEFGHAEKYRLTIRKKDSVLFEEEFDGKEEVALTRVPVTVGADFTYSISSIDHNGETPSESFRFSVLHNGLSSKKKTRRSSDLECKGKCAAGGVPLCYYGHMSQVEQFEDRRGAHCQCFAGYSDISCDRVGQFLSSLPLLS